MLKNTKIIDLKINPTYEALVPRVTADEYATMKDSIKTHGIREPLVINKENIIIDGHTRYQIAKELGINEVPTREENYPNRYMEMKAVIEYNLHRRQLNLAQKCELGLVYAKILGEEAEERRLANLKQNKKNENKTEVVNLPPRSNSLISQPEPTFKRNEENRIVVEVPSNEPYIKKEVLPVELTLVSSQIPVTTQTIAEINNEIDTGKTIEKAAAMVGVSPRTLQNYKNIVKAAETNPSLQKEREQAVNGIKSVNKVFNSAKQLEKREEKKETLRTRPLPEDKFEVIYADPPWEYEFSETEKRSLDNQYPQMKLEDICNLPINTTDDAILFLWTTSPKLEEGLKVLKAWGFTYKTNAVWIKDKIGMGYYFRQRHELLLIGVKGKIGVPDPADRPDSVIESPRTEHSKKPDIYETIEKMYPYRKYIELFARNDRKNWTSWGNETENK